MKWHSDQYAQVPSGTLSTIYTYRSQSINTTTVHDMLDVNDLIPQVIHSSFSKVIIQVHVR